MSISGRAVQVSNMRLHGYDLKGFSQYCKSFQQLHRKGRGKLGLGLALSTLGQRESGTARLEQAVVAYRAALEERTRDRVPRDWAQTQHNLGLALFALSDRES